MSLRQGRTPKQGPLFMLARALAVARRASLNWSHCGAQGAEGREAPSAHTSLFVCGLCWHCSDKAAARRLSQSLSRSAASAVFLDPEGARLLCIVYRPLQSAQRALAIETSAAARAGAHARAQCAALPRCSSSPCDDAARGARTRHGASLAYCRPTLVESALRRPTRQASRTSSQSECLAAALFPISAT